MKTLILWLLGLLSTWRKPIRSAVVSLWNNARFESLRVDEWNQTVIIRGMTLDEWLEYNRMAQLLTQQPTEAEPAAVPEPWLKYGHRALYAFVLVATLHDERRRPVFAPPGSAERARDIADVAAGFSAVHDRIVAEALRLSGIAQGSEEEPAPDPVAQAGNA